MGKLESNMMSVFVIGCYVILTVTALVFIKLGGEQTLTMIGGRIGLNVSVRTLLGLLLYVCSFIIYITIIPKYQLSYIVPVTTGLVYALTLVASVLIFKEKITWVRGFGTGLIAAGIVIMNIKR